MRPFLLGLALMLCLPMLGSAQELKPEMRTRNDLLRNLIGELELKPVNGFDEIGDDPSDVVLVVLGDPSWLKERRVGFLRQFVNRGGALLLATDHDLSSDPWLSELLVITGAWVVDAPVVCMAENSSYDGKPELPILVAADPFVGGPQLMRSLFEERRVAVSLPGHLRVGRGLLGFGAGLQGGVRPIAYLPEDSAFASDHRIRPNGGWVPRLPDASRLFAVGGPRGQGRVVLLADHHLFMNDLMVRPDLQNYEFASATLGYLTEGSPAGGKRSRCLYIENGEIANSFEVPLEDLSEFPLEALFRAAHNLDIALGVMDERGHFQNAFWNALGQNNVSPERLALLTAALLTLVGGVYLIYRLLRGRAPTEPNLPRLARSLEKQVPTARLTVQRRQEQVDLGRLHEPARHLARALFTDLGLTPATKPPTVRLAGGWWQRRRTVATFRRVWKIAFAVRALPVTARQWPGFVRDLASLRQGFLEGSIQLESVQVA